MPRQYSPQFRQRVLGLLAEGRSVGQLAAELGISVLQPCIDGNVRTGLTLVNFLTLIQLKALNLPMRSDESAS